MNLPIQILPTDLTFPDSPDPGDPRCICSRCQEEIPETTLPIRGYLETATGTYELRFHPECLGITVYEADDNFDYDPYEQGEIF